MLNRKYLKYIEAVLIKNNYIKMDKFENIKKVNSPISLNSPNINTYSYSSSIKKSNTFNEPKQLYFGTPKDSFIRQSQIIDSSKPIYRNVNSLSEQRLTKIAKGFVERYTSQNQLSIEHAMQIQLQAHIHTKFECNSETAQSLFTTLDQNRDKKVSQEDILSLCRRYLSFDKKQIIYTPIVQERLAVARRLFKQFDVDKKGYLTQKQVPTLLEETYRTLGKSFTATEEDVRSWMRLTDGDGDGIVNLQEYEKSIIRALKKQGVKIYEQ